MPEISGMRSLVNSANISGNSAQASKDFKTFESAAGGLRHQEELLANEASDGRQRFLVWQAPQALIVGPTEGRLSNLTTAANHLRSEGWPVVRRHSGGSTCPVSSETLQIAIARLGVPGVTIETAYQQLASLICTVIRSYGLEPAVGIIPNSFCPGRFDISISGRKVAGLSQRWHHTGGRMIVTTASTLIVDGGSRYLVQAVNLFYRFIGKTNFCSESAVGSLRQSLPAPLVGDNLLDDVSHRLLREWSSAASIQTLEH